MERIAEHNRVSEGVDRWANNLDTLNGVDPSSSDSISNDPAARADIRRQFIAARDLATITDAQQAKAGLEGVEHEILSYLSDRALADTALAKLSLARPAILTEFVPGDIGVTGTALKPNGIALGLPIVDALVNQSGNVVDNIGTALNDHPWAGYALTALGFAADAASGPVKFALAQATHAAIGQVEEGAAQLVADRFSAVNYADPAAARAGAGAVFLGTLLLGATGAVSLLRSGRLSGWIANIKGRLGRTPERTLTAPEEVLTAPGSLSAARAWTIKSRLGAHDLPTSGRIRFVPERGYDPSDPLPRGLNKGFLDRFGNEWLKGPSRTQGQAFEWDVQLSRMGQNQLGWASKDGAHLNVSLDGHITH